MLLAHPSLRELSHVEDDYGQGPVSQESCIWLRRLTPATWLAGGFSQRQGMCLGQLGCPGSSQSRGSSRPCRAWSRTLDMGRVVLSRASWCTNTAAASHMCLSTSVAIATLCFFPIRQCCAVRQSFSAGHLVGDPRSF